MIEYPDISAIDYAKNVRCICEEKFTKCRDSYNTYKDSLVIKCSFEEFLILSSEELFIIFNNSNIANYKNAVSTNKCEKKFKSIHIDSFTKCFGNNEYKNYLKNIFKDRLNTCPYCNGSFVINFERDNANVIQRYNFDHMIPKSKYPIFALCLNNLIPVCNTCNKLKGEYEIKYNVRRSTRFKFSYTITTEYKQLVTLKFQGDESEKFYNKLGIKDIYEQNSDYLLKPLFDQTIKYTDIYQGQLINILNEVNISEAELKALIFGTRPDDKDLIKQPFSKFKRDILEELGIW